jgi:peptide/nickel transport system substrate-binding protein
MAVGIIPEGSGATIAEHPIGTGPFRFLSYVESQAINLEAFPEAFQGGPTIQHLQIKIIRDPTTLSLELLSGTVHVAVNTRLSPDFVEEQRRLESLKVVISDGASLEYLVLNTSDPMLADKRVRQAIAYGLDRQAIIENLLQHQAREAITVLPLHHWAYNPDVKRYEYNPGKARELLDAAGFADPDGAGPRPRLHLTLKSSSVEYSRHIATILQEQLRLIGVDLELQSYEFQTYVNYLNRGEFQIGFLRLVGGYFPDIFQAAFGARSIPYDPTINDQERTGFLNRARYRHAELDQLIAQADTAKGRQAPVNLYGRIQEMLANDVPWVYLWYPSNVAVMSPRVGNVRLPATGDFFFIKDLTFAR